MAALSTANPGTSVLAALDPPTKHSFIPFPGTPGAWEGQNSFLGQGSHTCSILPTDCHLGGDGHMDIKLCPTGIHLQLLRWGKGAPSPSSANVPKGKVSPVVCHCSRAGSLKTISLGVNMMLKVIRSFHAEDLWHSNVNKFQNKGFDHSTINFPHEPFWMTGGWQSKYKCNFFFKNDFRHIYTASVGFQEESVGTSDSKIKLYISCGSLFPPKTANALIPWHSDF